MTVESLFERATFQLAEERPFVLYRKPDGGIITGIFQKSSVLHLVSDYKEIGYVFAPFADGKTVLIPESDADVMQVGLAVSGEVIITNFEFPEDTEARDTYIELVEKAINAIASGAFSKIVLSRKETVKVTDFDIESAYTKLLNLYPNAFAYCFFHPEIGLWMGAFSEQLLKLKEGKLETMSVAGTQKTQNSANGIVWEDKEKTEQELVTSYIFSQLDSIADTIEVTNPYTLKAGSLAHIKTDIYASLSNPSDLKSAIRLLHPTPAVCGLPKEEAKTFIIQNENYDREYYSGFHGELNVDFVTGEKQTDLFVNLRCMKIETEKDASKAHLFIGGGITDGSNPEKEWTETVNKSQTMKRVLL